jgi:predicted small lipoprotein YifL
MFVWCGAHLGMSFVNRKSSPTVSGWAIIVVSALALTLAGCGRKGGLDAPPGALGASGDTANVAQAPGQDTAAGKSSSLFSSGNNGNDSSMATPKGKNRPFVLDPLLNSQ